MNDSRKITATDLFNEIRALASSKGFVVNTVPWLRTVRAFTDQLDRSKKNLEQGGWTFVKHNGGRNHQRHIEFMQISDDSKNAGSG